MTTSVTTLLHQAGAGDQAAWEDIVQRYSGLLWSITRRCGLPPSHGADVVQTTWLRLSERNGAIREPEHLGGWLTTVAQREAWRAAARWRRDLSTEDVTIALPDTHAASVEDEVLQRRTVADLRRAIEQLPDRQRELMRILISEGEPSYHEISARTGMPIGSIGPTRARAVARLRQILGVVDAERTAQPACR